MRPYSIPRAVVTLVLSLVFVLPAAAARRRAVSHPARAAKVTGNLSGRITDASTGLPVIDARIDAGKHEDTNTNGEFTISGAWGYRTIDVEISRSGYLPFQTTLPAGDHVLNVQLTPTPTVLLRKTDSTQVQIDFESLEFGYVAGFISYQAPYEDFCLPDGGTVRYHRSEMKRIVGPLTWVDMASCCSKAQTMKISIELKGAAPADFFFADSCFTVNAIVIRAREHVSGQERSFPLTEVAEVVFP